MEQTPVWRQQPGYKNNIPHHWFSVFPVDSAQVFTLQIKYSGSRQWIFNI